jgi:hypothetical protein
MEDTLFVFINGLTPWLSAKEGNNNCWRKFGGCPLDMVPDNKNVLGYKPGLTRPNSSILRELCDGLAETSRSLGRKPAVPAGFDGIQNVDKS